MALDGVVSEKTLPNAKRINWNRSRGGQVCAPFGWFSRSPGPEYICSPERQEECIEYIYYTREYISTLYTKSTCNIYTILPEMHTILRVYGVCVLYYESTYILFRTPRKSTETSCAAARCVPKVNYERQVDFWWTGRSPPWPPFTLWTTSRSSKVDLPRIIDFRARTPSRSTETAHAAAGCVPLVTY